MCYLRRYDEGEGGSAEEETNKRKRDFSDLFKKQMDLRKVISNSNGQYQRFKVEITYQFSQR